MTENKRYFDGSLAKWYYSRDYSGMRVISNGIDEFAFNSKKQFKDINSKELKGTNQLLDELNKLEDKIINLKKENEQLKQDKFICLDCKYSGYIEIGCLCEKKDHWTDYKTECEDYEELE